MARFARFAFAAGILAILYGCQGGSSPRDLPVITSQDAKVGRYGLWPQIPPQNPALNVILITLDTTRQDHLSCYGFAKKTSPVIDRLAAAVRRGEAVLVGETPITRRGVSLASLARFGARDELVSYDSLEFKSESGQLVLSSKLNPWLSDSWEVADTWNAVIFRQLVEAVQRE